MKTRIVISLVIALMTVLLSVPAHATQTKLHMQTYGKACDAGISCGRIMVHKDSPNGVKITCHWSGKVPKKKHRHWVKPGNRSQDFCKDADGYLEPWGRQMQRKILRWKDYHPGNDIVYQFKKDKNGNSVFVGTWYKITDAQSPWKMRMWWK